MITNDIGERLGVVRGGYFEKKLRYKLNKF